MAAVYLKYDYSTVSEWQIAHTLHDPEPMNTRPMNVRRRARELAHEYVSRRTDRCTAEAKVTTLAANLYQGLDIR